MTTLKNKLARFMPAKKAMMFLMALSLGLAACDSNNVYKEAQGLAQFAWPKSQTLTFTVDIADDAPLYDAKLSFRHVSSIPYGDFKLKANIASPSGKNESVEIVVPIRDKATGDLIGEAMGDMCDTDFAFLKGVKLEKGKTTITLNQMMEEDPFVSIMEVWLLVDKVASK